MLSIIIPTYNEAKNINYLIKDIEHYLPNIQHEIIVVDDNSPDLTHKIVLEFATENKFPIKVIVRTDKKDLSSAVVEGIKASSGNIICIMDADLQHPPSMIPCMYEYANNGIDVIIATRADFKGLNFKRRCVSSIAKGLSQLLIPKISQIKDPMSGFFMFRKSIIEGVELNPIGFKILLEILVKGKGTSSIEVPFSFGTRKDGKSHFGLNETIKYIKHLFRLSKHTGDLDKLIKFSIVGISGVYINEFLLYTLTDSLKLFYVISSVIAIQISIITNFVLNSVWTFNNENMTKDKFIKFESVCILGASVNFIILIILTSLFNIHYLISNLIAILIAFVVNYSFSRKYVWK